MVNDFIQIQRDQSAATEAAELLSTIRDGRSVYERYRRIRDKMKHCFDDSGGEAAIDWSALETLWGIPAGETSTGPTASGAIVYTLIDGTVLAAEGSQQNSATVGITERVG